MNNDNMTFTVTAYNKTVTITMPDDIDMHEFLDTCRTLAMSTGYHENSWKDAVIEMADDYLESDRIMEENNNNLWNYTDKASHKVYTGKSDLITHWGPLNKHIPDTNC